MRYLGACELSESVLAGAFSTFSCCTAPNAGAGLARPLAEAAKRAGTGGAASWNSRACLLSVRGLWGLIRAHYVSRWSG